MKEKKRIGHDDRINLQAAIAKAHQLPRYVRFSHKHGHSEKKPVNVERMLGRTYSDCRRFVESHPEANYGNAARPGGRPRTGRRSSP